MRITDLLSASSIDLNAKPLNKKEAIEQACESYRYAFCGQDDQFAK